MRWRAGNKRGTPLTTDVASLPAQDPAAYVPGTPTLRRKVVASRVVWRMIHVT